MKRLPPKTQWLFTLLFLWGMLSISYSQSIDRQVLGASGVHAVQGNLALDYTVGEAVVLTLSNHGLLITQGFHQPLLDSIVHTIPVNGDFTLRLFPNPFTDWITIIPEGIGYQGVIAVTMYDMQGRAVFSDKLRMPDTHTLWLSSLPAGAYALHLNDKSGRPLWSGAILKAH